MSCNFLRIHIHLDLIYKSRMNYEKLNKEHTLYLKFKSRFIFILLFDLDVVFVKSSSFLLTYSIVSTVAKSLSLPY